MNKNNIPITLRYALGLVGVTTLLFVLKLIFNRFESSQYLLVSQMLLIVNIFCTFFMMGLIWVVQIVNYPLFKNVGDKNFVLYHTKHVWRVTCVVAIPMFFEAISSIMLLYYPHPHIPAQLILYGVALIFVVWLSTLFLLVPQHDALLKSFDIKAYQRINVYNWVRTVAWTLRGVICVIFLINILNI